MQLGSGRFKTHDRDCAALTYLARQGGGRGQTEEAAVDELRAAVRNWRGLVADRKKAQQRLHDQKSPLCKIWLHLDKSGSLMLHVDEPRVMSLECGHDGAGRSIAIFGDDEVSLAQAR